MVDILIQNGLIVDGSGEQPYPGNLVIQGDRIAAVGQTNGRARLTINANGQAVAPGFINMSPSQC